MGKFSHLLGSGDAQQSQAVGQHQAHGVSQLQPGQLHLGLLPLDAAGVVEAVEVSGQSGEIAVDAAGVVVLGRQSDLIGELGQVLDEVPLLLAGNTVGSTWRQAGTSTPSAARLAMREQMRAWAYWT